LVDPRLVTVFCDALRLSATEPVAAIGAALATVRGSARRAWPAVDVADDVFIPHLATQAAAVRGLISASAIDALARLATDDLYLAAALSRGVPAALVAFEATFLDDLRRVIRRTTASADPDELMQGLRESLFVARADTAPKILEYSGRGGLRAWLRVVTTRAALNAVGRGLKERLAEDEELIDVVGDGSSVELSYFRTHYESELNAVLPLALEALSARERLYLRQHYLDELTLSDMSRLHGVHAATIKRHLSQARALLTERLRMLLGERLKVSPSELDSILALVRSRLHITMRRLLP